jgi:restriction system protein
MARIMKFLLFAAVVGVAVTASIPPAGLAIVVMVTVAIIYFAKQLFRNSNDSRLQEPTLKTEWSLELLRSLEWHRFELLCRAYFEKRGYISKTTRFGADGGVDILLYREGSDAPEALVQCKAWNAYKVGIKPVRELLGVMLIENAKRGALVTSGTFTREAHNLAEQVEALHLIGGKDLLQRIADLGEEKSSELLRVATEGDFTTPTCPSCGVKMTWRENSKNGSIFWGCVNFPRCRQRFSARSSERYDGAMRS